MEEEINIVETPRLNIQWDWKEALRYADIFWGGESLLYYTNLLDVVKLDVCDCTCFFAIKLA